jgi:hypothetical protein
MKECNRCRDLFVEALYDELDAEAKAFFANHLASCPTCAVEHKAMVETLQTMDTRVRPDPGRSFWDGYWDRLAGRMERERAAVRAFRPWWKRLGRISSLSPRWAFQAAASVVLIVVGVLIGRSVFSPRPAPLDITRPTAQAPAVQPAADDPVLRAQNYIDQSKLVLLALVNHNPATEDSYALNLPYQKQISQRLVTEAGRLRSDLKDPGQRRLRELVSDLETILIQIANLESENDFEAVEFVKQGVENRGLLLKINLSEMGGDLPRGKPKPLDEKTPSRKTNA